MYTRYTPEQLEKIESLRNEAKKDAVAARATVNWLESYQEFKEKQEVKLHSRVKVTIDGITVVGYITSVEGGLFNVSTPYGVMKNIHRKHIDLRNYVDLSHVVIPEELKKETTPVLLSELNSRRFYYDEVEYFHRLGKFTEDQIRAELRTRPNIKSKRCQRVVNRYTK